MICPMATTMGYIALGVSVPAYICLIAGLTKEVRLTMRVRRGMEAPAAPIPSTQWVSIRWQVRKPVVARRRPEPGAGDARR